MMNYRVIAILVEVINLKDAFKLKGLQAVAQFDELSTILNRYFVEHHQKMPEIKYQVLLR